jgi:hypothetical protein
MWTIVSKGIGREEGEWEEEGEGEGRKNEVVIQYNTPVH